MILPGKKLKIGRLPLVELSSGIPWLPAGFYIS